MTVVKVIFVISGVSASIWYVGCKFEILLCVKILEVFNESLELLGIEQARSCKMEITQMHFHSNLLHIS